MYSELRHRRHNIVNVVQQLDAFPKVNSSVEGEKKPLGGVVLLAFLSLSVWLIWCEFQSYFQTTFKYRFSVDTTLDSRFQLNLDITVAMPCELIGTDVVDSTDQPIITMGKLEMEPTNFAMSPEQSLYWGILNSVNKKHLPGVNALENMYWVDPGVIGKLDRENEKRAHARGRKDSCRIHGSLGINKVTGNFHLSVGRTLVLGGNMHAHLSFMLSEDMYNFTHRIEHFSFGNRVNELVHPLDGTEKITTNSMLLFQYYIKIVPIKIHHHTHSTETYQYSVTKRNRTIDHTKGSHGVPGLFFKYDFSGMCIEAFDRRPPPWMLAVRLCAIVGGVFATSALLQMLMATFIDCLLCRCFKFCPDSPEVKAKLELLRDSPDERNVGSAFQL